MIRGKGFPLVDGRGNGRQGKTQRAPEYHRGANEQRQTEKTEEIGSVQTGTDLPPKFALIPEPEPFFLFIHAHLCVFCKSKRSEERRVGKGGRSGQRPEE